MQGASGEYRPWLSRALAGGFTALQLGQLFLLPAWLLPRDPAWGWLLLVPVLLTNGWWAFIHEAIHGTLFPDRMANRRLGRLQGIPYGAAFDLLRWGHLLHHAYNRTERDRSEVYPDGKESGSLFTLNYYARLLGGLYVFEVLWSLLLLAPRRLLLWLSTRLAGPANPIGPLADKLLARDALMAVRKDALLILALHGLALYLYGPHAWMLLAALAGRALLISLMDNVFHYGTGLEDRRFARNLALPSWQSLLILHFNLHGTHHRHPTLAWWALPAVHLAEGGGYQGRMATATRDQLRGPIPATRLTGSKAASI